jgi:hypothetical protein
LSASIYFFFFLVAYVDIFADFWCDLSSFFYGFSFLPPFIRKYQTRWRFLSLQVEFVAFLVLGGLFHLGLFIGPGTTHVHVHHWSETTSMR